MRHNNRRSFSQYHILETTLELLAHRLPEIQKEMYALCHKKVVANIGTQINMSHTGTAGSQILFLLNIRILTQITLFGLNNEYVSIKKEANTLAAGMA